MPTVRTKNQQNPPLPKKKRVDSLGNNRKRLFFKSGNATILFCKGLTEPGCKVLIEKIDEFMSKLGTKTEGTWLIAQ